MRRIAYLRVSTADQRPDRQIIGLRGMADELHIEKLSAVARTRPVFEEVKARLRSGDMLVVWALDRAFRSAKDAINELDALRDKGICFHIAAMNLDTTTPYGRHQYQVMSANAELERALLIERTKEGIEAARARGVKIGRPPKLSDMQLFEAHCRIMAGEPCAQIAAEYGVWPWTLTRAIRRSMEARSH
jgi:DNA invertase Pin-like site-specific DNA recombinase